MGKNACLVFTSRIKESYGNLTRAGKRLADYMVENPDGVLNATASSLAEATGVSTATVIRFCRICGYGGLTDLKSSLKREYNALNDILDPNEIRPGDTAAIIRQKVLGYHNIIINSIMADWNEAVYLQAVDALLAAKRIVILGEGGSRASAFCLYDICLQLGLDCELCQDTVFEIMRVDALQPGDVVVGLTYTGRMRSTVESMKLAKERHAVTIGLIGAIRSPALDYTDILLNTNMVEKDYFDTALSVRVSELAVIEILYSLLAVRLGRRTENAKNINQAVDRRRIN